MHAVIGDINQVPPITAYMKHVNYVLQVDETELRWRGGKCEKKYGSKDRDKNLTKIYVVPRRDDSI
jgi:hypothetical protein